jgi:inorganic triphosphatase YgiF
MRELELKFALPLSLQDSLLGRVAGERIEQVWSCYHDTPDGALARARTAVRVRRMGERWVQTVKADDGDRFERFEWERPIAGPAPERDALPPESTPAGALVHRTFAQWRPLFETDFERRARRIEPAPGLAIELAQDVGEIRCGERRAPIREVELECLEGSRAAFFAWALAWAEREQACLLMPTKNERGLRLAARLPRVASPAKAAPEAPAADAAPGEAAARIVAACVSHACANLEPVLAGDDAEGPHQLRVALRRLRAVLRWLRLAEVDPRWVEVDSGAKALADAAGRVRDLDVFESGALRLLHDRLPGDAAVETLTRAVLDARESARHALRCEVAGPATTRLVLRALALGAALAEDEAPAFADGATAFGPIALARLRALHRRVRRRAQCAVDAEGWHRTRLAVKTLRYALEFAAHAMPGGSDAARAQSLLSRWQDRLGAGQDLASARHVAAGALSRPGVTAEAAVRALGLIDGWLAFAPAATDGDPRRDARRTLRALGAALARRPRKRDHGEAAAALPPSSIDSVPNDTVTEPTQPRTEGPAPPAAVR